VDTETKYEANMGDKRSLVIYNRLKNNREKERNVAHMDKRGKMQPHFEM
jgi:hypothetical protein